MLFAASISFIISLSIACTSQGYRLERDKRSKVLFAVVFLVHRWWDVTCHCWVCIIKEYMIVWAILAVGLGPLGVLWLENTPKALVQVNQKKPLIENKAKKKNNDIIIIGYSVPIRLLEKNTVFQSHNDKYADYNNFTSICKRRITTAMLLMPTLSL